MHNDCNMDTPELPALLIDASGQCIATGVLGDKNTWQSYNELNGTALETLFKCIEIFEVFCLFVILTPFFVTNSSC